MESHKRAEEHGSLKYIARLGRAKGSTGKKKAHDKVVRVTGIKPAEIH